MTTWSVPMTAMAAYPAWLHYTTFPRCREPGCLLAGTFTADGGPVCGRHIGTPAAQPQLDLGGTP